MKNNQSLKNNKTQIEYLHDALNEKINKDKKKS